MTSTSGSALLVPVAVDVLVLTETSLNNGGWSWNTPNYTFLSVFEPPVQILAPSSPTPIAPDGTPGRTGTVLRWALPDGLTHAPATDDTTGALAFPAVPNRWLVHRFVAGSPALDSSWIIASDAVVGTGTSFPVAAGPTRLGKCWPLADWPGEAALPAGMQPPLTALGPGDPSFAAFTPNLQHILAFHDPLTDVPAGPVSYLLAGWYAGSAPDPLDPTAQWQNADDWTALAEEFGWSVGDDLPDAASAAQSWIAAQGQAVDPSDPHTFLPTRTLCHGLVSAVTWPGPSGAAESGVPVADPALPATRPVITLAHTPADALATVVATAAGQQGTQVAEALSALLNDLLPLLDEPDGSDQLAGQLQTTWFQRLAGGTLWRLDSPEQPDAPAGELATALTGAQAAALDALNAAQVTLDSAERDLTALQAEVYALWWKQRYVQVTGRPNAATGQLVTATFTATTARATQAVSDYIAAEQARDAAQAVLTPLIGDLVLGSSPEPDFLRPNDPVVMVQGVGRSYAHGQDGRYSEDGSLYCRLSGQTIDSLLVTGTSSPVTATTLGRPALAGADVPAEVADLAVEAFLLDPANAAVIGSAASPNQPATVVAAQQTLMWNALADVPLEQQTLADAAGLASAFGPVSVPSKIGVNYWSPPWSPLYLDWSASYYPSGTDRTGWAFPAPDPSDPLAEQTAQWVGTAPTSSYPLQGRTVLTPQATDLLSDRLSQLVDQFGAAPDLQPYLADMNAAIDYLRDACVLSQTLSGFTDLTQQRDQSTFRQPDLTVLGPWLEPAGAPAYRPTAAPAPGSSVPFSPVIGGFLGLHELWVIDAFGQRYDALGSLAADPAADGLQFGPDLTPLTGTTLAQLKPRLAQPCRLRLRFLDAQDDSQAVGSATGADPICGWLVPNRLDQGVLVYDRAGILLGELVLAAGGAVWLAAPDEVSASSPVGPPAIANTHLDNVVNGILTGGDPGGALSDLIATITAASWATAPTGPGVDELSALVGFPVAVARAELMLETYGPPATSQLWADTGQDQDGGLSAAVVAVQLGTTQLYSDGLIGVVADSDPTHLISPYGPSANGYANAGTQPVSANQPQPMTLLMHPQTQVHAFTGMLPATVAALPASSQVTPLNTMAITFRAGPLLTPATGILAPQPAFGHGDWAWLEYRGDSAPAQPRPVGAVDTVASLLTAAPTLHDGWLRLVQTGQPTQLTYAITPTAVTTGGATAPATQLVLTAYNATTDGVAVDAIGIHIPSVGDADALSASPDRLVLTPPPGWTVAATGGPAGGFTVQPDPTAAVDAGATLTFVLSGLVVDATTGLSLIGIDETTAAGQVHLDLVVEKIPSVLN